MPKFFRDTGIEAEQERVYLKPAFTVLSVQYTCS
jgi:hypothetical protein